MDHSQAPNSHAGPMQPSAGHKTSMMCGRACPTTELVAADTAPLCHTLEIQLLRPASPPSRKTGHLHALDLTATRARHLTITMPPKTGFSRAKNVGYDDDDIYDDYSEEEYAGEGEGEGMSEEDKEQMAAGVIKVREALGSEYKVKEVDIQDALWNYFYDVGKSVTFLKSAYVLGAGESKSVFATATVVDCLADHDAVPR